MSHDIKFKFKELFNHGIIYGISSFLHSGLSFILLPLLTSYYSPEIFGVYSIILLIGVVSNSIFYLGASSALSRFYFDYNDKKHYKKIVSLGFIITLFGASTLIVLGFLISNYLSILLFENEEFSFLITLNFLSTAIMIIYNYFVLILRFQKKSIFFSFTMLFNFICNFTITYILLSHFEKGLLAPIFGVLVPSAFSVIVFLIYYRNFISFKIDKKYLKLMLSFGIQSSILGFLVFNLEWIDRLIIKHFLDLESVGIYSLAYKIAAIINILLITPFTFIWAPMRMEYLKDNNSNKFMTKVISFYTILGVSIIFISILFGKYILGLIISDSNYHYAFEFFPIIMLAIMFYGYQNILDIGVYVSNKLYYIILIYVMVLILNFTLNYFFVPNFGFLASAYITLLTYFVSSLTIFIISNYFQKINIDYSKVLIPIISLVLFYFINNKVENLIFKSILVLIIFAFFYLFLLDDEEKNIIKELKK